MRRTSTDAARPVPFSAKFQKVHQSVTGVTVLEHLERLDAVEASLKRLGGGEDAIIEEDDEEIDVGESSQTKPVAIPQNEDYSFAVDGTPSQVTPPGSPPLASVPEHMPLENSVTEEDLAQMSKSMSHAEGPPIGHTRWASIHGRQEEGMRTLDWMQTGEEQNEGQKGTTVIVERLETINRKPLLSCW